jgi:RNA polymerase sigma-54 factor
LTPQQVQYLQLLQLPSLQLEQKIKEELESNPLLEELTDEEAQQYTNDNNSLTIDEPVLIPSSNSVQNADAEIEQPKQERTNDYTIEDFMNDELEGYKVPRGSHSTDDDDDHEKTGAIAVESFSDSLLSQLKFQNVTPRMMLLAEEIIGSLDEDGYLRVPLEQIVQDTSIYYGEEFLQSEAERLLKKIQHLDPIGIAARDLKECLLIQLDVKGGDSSAKELATTILKDFYELYVKKKYDLIAKKLKMNVTDLKAADQLIQRLDPMPGKAPSSVEITRYISPDFFIEKAPNGKDFTITLNERGIPTLRVNAAYKKLVKQSGTDGKPVDQDVKKFIYDKFQSAKDFLLAIYQRRETLMKVMTAIVSHQHEFFEKGERFLRPLVYKQVAEQAGVDISTISRVVNGKYCQSEEGVYELKYFFSEAVTFENDDGEHESVSNKVVKGRIKELIESESQGNPFSDEHLVELLKSDGYTVARRTLAKYREQMNIPVARMRKKIM